MIKLFIKLFGTDAVLSKVATCDLHNAMAAREGVKEIWVENKRDKRIYVCGPARVLINKD